MELNAFAVNENGFLSDYQTWAEHWAKTIAQNYQLELTAAHWEIIYFMREFYKKYQYLPNTRVFIKTIAMQLDKDKGNSVYLHRLFTDKPLKVVCHIAGLPKPPNCI